MEYYIRFITAAFIAVGWIWGFEFTFKDGEIFGRPGNWMRAHLPEWVNKPLFDCKFCMSSAHGTIMYLILLSGYPWYMWIVFCFSCCGMTAIFDNK
jgi:hypothetical protein